LYLPGHPNSLITFHSKIALLWGFSVAGNKTYLGLHVKFPILNKFGSSRQSFIKVSKLKFHGNPSRGSRSEVFRLAEMTELIGVFRDYANAANNRTNSNLEIQEAINSALSTGVSSASRNRACSKVHPITGHEGPEEE
jgi:hypothetical protein